MKRIVSGLIALLFLSSMMVLPSVVRAEASIWLVDDDAPADFHTIQEAINVAANGDTVLVRNGTYHEHVIVNKTVSLIGESREGAIIDGCNASIAIDVVSSSVTINGFTIVNSFLFGIFVASDYNHIQNNIQYGGRFGVGYTQVGIQLFGSHYNVIEKNCVFNNKAQGITLGHSSHNEIRRNHVANNSVGVFLYYSDENAVRSNNVTDSILFGIQLSDNSSSNQVVENTVLDNVNGIALTAASSNIFYHNNFIENANQVYRWESKPSAWDNGYPSGGNYWSDYAGTDSDGDDLGDIPYIIDSNNTDNYPLMQPWAPPAHEGDVNRDGKVDIKDIAMVSAAFGSYPKHPRWKLRCDINQDDRIDIVDLARASANFGWHR